MMLSRCQLSSQAPCLGLFLQKTGVMTCLVNLLAVLLLKYYMIFVKWCRWLFIGLELLKEAIAKAGYTGKIDIGMDVAASEFCKEGKYDLDFKNPNSDKSLWVSTYRETFLFVHVICCWISSTVFFESGWWQPVYNSCHYITVSSGWDFSVSQSMIAWTHEHMPVIVTSYIAIYLVACWEYSSFQLILTYKSWTLCWAMEEHRWEYM